MLGPELELKLSIPEQTLVTLTFAEASQAGIEKWVSNLPVTNVGETSRLLYMAIRELNDLVVAPATRSKMLEVLRPSIHYICDALGKHFLGQPVVLPEKQQKIANLTQALQIHLATGYKVIMAELLSDLANEKSRKAFACAAHRMISEYGNVLLRSYQLYSAAPKNVWFELHQTFQFCEQIGLMKYVITDDTNKYLKDTRIDQAYKRCLLLACSRPNQLRQDDIRLMYEAFEQWSDFVEMSSQSSQGAFFVVNLQQDLPPRYRSLMHDTLADYYYGLDTAELVSRLTSFLTSLNTKQGFNNAMLPCPKGMSDMLLSHLNMALGILTKRTFKRISSTGGLELCVGLSACHFYISGEVEFHQQMLESSGKKKTKDEDNVFLSQARKRNDAWSGAFDASGSKEAMATHADTPIAFNRPVVSDPKKAYPRFEVPLINTSPGGYCLQWQGDIPANVQAGELIGIRENKQAKWSIAVIRWIRSAKQKGTQLGVELLAPNAQPCGVQLHHKTGAPSEFMRGLLLPELSSIGQCATIITPRVPFQSGSKVAVKRKGDELRSNLGRRVAATSSFSQFEIQLVMPADATESGAGNAGDAAPEDEFDSLWPSL